MSDNTYRTQADAKKAIVESIWGTVPYAQREMVYPEPGLAVFQTVVAADVNGDLVVFSFDAYGRLNSRQVNGTTKPLVIKNGCR